MSPQTVWGLLSLVVLSVANQCACSTNEPVVITQRPADADSTESVRPRKVSSTNHSITIVGNEFMLDGQPLHIISGSLHYFRLPAAYWRDRLHKLKAAGLNSVSTYVEWSYHEPEERQYDFTGDRDIAQFIKIAAEEGLHVLLRPGPYICAERDLGGFPYWLLGKYPDIKLRTTDKNFIEESEIWLNKLFEQLTPLLFGNGGPIILVQIENEYGSYGNDMAYKQQMRDITSKHVGSDALLYTTDGPWRSYFTGGAVSGALTTIDFGPTKNDVRDLFKDLRTYMPSGPLMNSEYYTGWITHWGEPLSRRTSKDVVATLTDMLNNKMNVNFYMFFGGTNFEYSSGANFDGTYQPDITSYDYDSPLSEAGDPTPKYYDIRDAIMKFKNEVFEEPSPQPSPKGDYGVVPVSARLSVLSPQGRDALGKNYSDVTGPSLPTFESLRQRAGLMLYETTLEKGNGLLQIQKPRDLVFVYVDGVLKGKINRGKKILSLPIETKDNSVLSLLVENQGRINFGSYIHDTKGILSEVKYTNKVLNGTWKVMGFPLEKLDLNERSLYNASSTTQGPVLYEGQFTLPSDQPVLDTFLDTTGWGKGYIWVNGYNLGRYWPSEGPQVTLYVPGVWLKPAPEKNNLLILELQKPSEQLQVKLIDHPILDKLGF